jgi:hypothetical protein
MIDISVQPTHVVAGRRVRLAIRFTNTTQGPCSDIVFRLELPSGISLLEGRSRVEIPLIPAGGTHVHEITVEPSKSGEFELTSGNFSYRDQYGVSAYPADFRWKLSVAPGSPAGPTSPRPTPRLAVRLEDAFSKLPTGAWSEIKILVHNTSDVALGGVTVDVSGPLRTNGRQSQVPQLRPGATARFTFSVIAEESGQVPISVHLTFTYPDWLGSIRQMTQEDILRVVAGQDSVVGSGGTILYLSASPNDPDLELPAIRIDLEMKKIQERLQLSKTRGQYEIKFRPASEWDDLSQALVDYDPRVVHFSAHGDSDGNLLLENAVGGVALTTPEGLASLFGLHRATITCVIVNACYSERLARAMSQHIDYVVGMRWQIGEEAAIEFSVGFYTGLFAGHPVPEAFKRGLAHIQRSEATKLEYRTPLLLPEP